MNGRLGQFKWPLLIGAAIGVAVTGAVLVVVYTDLTGETTQPGPAYLYNIKGYRKTDPKLIGYHEAGAFDTEMKEPRAIAVDAQDRIYLAGDRAVRMFRVKFREAGMSAREMNGPRAIATEPDGLAEYRQIPLARSPYCLAAAPDGTIYVGVSDRSAPPSEGRPTDCVEVYSPHGQRQAAWGSLDAKATLTSIALSAEHVFVADAGNRIVLHYDTSGKLLGRIGKKDPDRNIPGFMIPSPYFDVAVGPEGLLWVANTGHHRLESYTFDGDRETWWGKPSMGYDGFSGCCNPANFTILPGGRFVTAEKGLPRVKVCWPDGVLDCVVAGPEQFAEETHLDVAADSQGRIFVLDPSRKSVRVFARNGAK